MGIVYQYLQGNQNMDQDDQLKQGFACLADKAWGASNRAFETVLSRSPHCAAAWYGLGLSFVGQRDFQKAVGCFERAVAIAPQSEQYQHCLGKAQLQVGQMAFEEKQFFQAIAYGELAAKQVFFQEAAVRLIAWSYIELQQADLALNWCDRLLQLNPLDVQAHYNQGVLWMQGLQWAPALLSFQRVLQLAPQHIDAMLNMAATFLKIDQHEKSNAYYASVLAISPGHPIASYSLSVSQGKTCWSSAPDEFISRLYDRYAMHYEHQMVQQLQYRVPNLFLEIIQRLPKEKAWRLLDLGCGTGLVGEKLRDVTSFLVGVDISAAMLKIAENKKIYDVLQCQTFDAYLAVCEDKFDVVYAADSLIYTGDLLPLFQKIKSVLLPKGYFLFSVERHQDKSDFQLQPTGRFTHGEDYLRKISKISGFSWVVWQSCVLRMQQGEAVKGEIGLLMT